MEVTGLQLEPRGQEAAAVVLLLLHRRSPDPVTNHIMSTSQESVN